ncbi:flagellar L-ring protein precursor [Azospirillum sp. B510]|uniref:flagellar basal body L-ring protein FlgH n=1 Tax=Azospirillum sp. (strain B510) TaxID=137722 RepID=UPI0001C4C208|nr:flagellar basal body L-ring protein FlgH [Azospirillum sp. B510]BAI72474.1 flagellar L-ring protein precursor [Azospirillum sp. B510]
MTATIMTARLIRFAMIATAATSLTACGAASRIADIGKAPEMSNIQDPQAKPGYQPVSLPMPTPLPTERNPNSLWRTGAKAFFKDQRAGKVGDILTINISIADQAKLSNESKRARANTEKAGIPNLFGMEGDTLNRILPTGASATNLVNMNSNTNNDGKGSVDRNEKIELKVAALVTQTLPNGNLVIQGRQEVRVNYELRDLQIHGVIRPEDITAQNTISYEKIAEARISYGGRGQITDVQQPRYGQQLYDIIMPF